MDIAEAFKLFVVFFSSQAFSLLYFILVPPIICSFLIPFYPFFLFVLFCCIFFLFFFSLRTVHFYTFFTLSLNSCSTVSLSAFASISFVSVLKPQLPYMEQNWFLLHLSYQCLNLLGRKTVFFSVEEVIQRTAETGEGTAQCCKGQ